MREALTDVHWIWWEEGVAASLQDGFQRSHLQVSKPHVVSLTSTGKAVSGTAEMIECDFQN